MFGIGFTEIILISIIAILFLGPDKLPGALVDMAKFIKSVKKTISETKNSLEEEMKISDLKEEALGYKKQLDDATSELKDFKNIDFDDFDDDVSYDEEVSTETPKTLASIKKEKVQPKNNDTEANTPEVETKNETVTFKKLEKENTNKESEKKEGKA
ncbi:MAG: Sec-independent protein translocase TatB [Epsilonproteobacteria bacterium]|nr:MAG: Sec-independent protein translocase TatB [Campylobacterota bacterium]